MSPLAVGVAGIDWDVCYTDTAVFCVPRRCVWSLLRVTRRQLQTTNRKHLQSTRTTVNQHNSQTKHLSLSKRQPGSQETPISTAAAHAFSTGTTRHHYPHPTGSSPDSRSQRSPLRSTGRMRPHLPQRRNNQKEKVQWSEDVIKADPFFGRSRVRFRVPPWVSNTIARDHLA